MCRSAVDSSPWFLTRLWCKPHRPLRSPRRQGSSGQARAVLRREPAKSAHEQITIEVKVTVSYPLQKISALHQPVLPPLCIRTFLAPIPSPRFAHGAISQHEIRRISPTCNAVTFELPNSKNAWITPVTYRSRARNNFDCHA